MDIKTWTASENIRLRRTFELRREEIIWRKERYNDLHEVIPSQILYRSQGEKKR